MPTPRGVRSGFAAAEPFRFRAVRLFARREAPAAVARASHVTPITACPSCRARKAQGRNGFNRARPAGQKPRLAGGQLLEVDAALRRGAPCHGFDTNLWTLFRVAVVIRCPDLAFAFGRHGRLRLEMTTIAASHETVDSRLSGGNRAEAFVSCRWAYRGNG
jgi:hypothetical protein